MKRVYQAFLGLILLGSMLVSTSAFSQAEVLDAKDRTATAAVNEYISKLLTEMEVIQPLYESDREQYFASVQRALSEFVDFREVARGVMAKYSTGPNGASENQLDRFADVFRTSFVEFYGSAMANYGGGEFDFLENRREPRNPENATNVRMSLVIDDGSRIEVQYTMFINDDSLWQLKNLYVEGVNLRRQYYSRFDDLMQRSDFNIDKVIDMWHFED